MDSYIFERNGRYQITLSLSIVKVEKHYHYRWRYEGSPFSSENRAYDSWDFESPEQAAQAAIERYGILRVTELGIAIRRPVKSIDN